MAKRELVQNEAARRRFRRESTVVRMLSHPHIAAVYEAMETANSYYLALEYVPGGTLLSYLVHRGELMINIDVT